MFRCITKFLKRKIVNIFLPMILTYVLGAQKNRHIEAVLLSTHNISLGLEMRKHFCYAQWLSGRVLDSRPRVLA